MSHSRLEPVAMLRRRSEFFLFLDDARAGKPGKEEQKEEHRPSPCEDYLGVLLQMKMTSDVSEQTGFPQVCSAPTGIKRKLELPLSSTYVIFTPWNFLYDVHEWVIFPVTVTHNMKGAVSQFQLLQ